MNFITLKELKKMVPVASEFKRVPGLKKILEDGIEVILRKQMENHAEVVVYKNGYVSYHKVFLNLTKRQLVCMGFAAGIGVPFYFLMRDTLGTSNAAAGMVLLMLPEFFFALYEKNGMHLETILTNFISVRFKRPAVRRYEVENLYERELETAAPIQKKGGILGKK